MSVEPGEKVFTVAFAANARRFDEFDFSGICPCRMLRLWANSAFFREVMKHTERCCGDACLAKTRPADESLPSII